MSGYRDIPEGALPIKKVGTGRKSNKPVYVLSQGSLDANVQLNLKAYGYLSSVDIELTTGKVISSCWLL